MISHAMAYDRELRDRFLFEARTIASLAPPNIVRVFSQPS